MTDSLPAVVDNGPVHTTPQPLGLDYLPSVSELQRLERMADLVSRSGIVPPNYRSVVAPDGRIVQDKRPNVLVAALMGRTFGWDLLTAMRNIHVIEGAATLKPEALLGLVRARGHRIKIVRGTDRVNIHARRVDTGDEMPAEFTFDDAYRAGLATPGKNGMPYARSSKGLPLPWEQYPIDMCQWRCVAIIARGLFSDIALGLSYLPEELGQIVDAEGDVVIEASPMPEAERRIVAEDQAVAAQVWAAQTPEAVEHRAAEKAREADQGAETPPKPGIAADEVAAYDAKLEMVAKRRKGPALNNAKARVWDAVKTLHPTFNDAALTAEVADHLAALNVEMADADTQLWNDLGEQLEAEVREAIEARYTTTDETEESNDNA
jgi:hypothetical protein